MKKILIFVIILSALKGFAQTKTIDSLKKAIDNYKKDDSIKIKMLYWYGFLLQETDIDASIRYTREGLQLANKLNRLDIVSFGDLRLSYLYGSANKEDSAIFVALQGLTASERLHLENLADNFYALLGEHYRLLHNYEQAEYYDNKYLDAAISQKNHSMTLLALLHLMSLYRQQDQGDKVKNI